MRYLLIPLVIASLACGATLQENNLPDAVTQSSTVTTTSEPILKYIVTAETLQYRDGAGEEFTALGYLSQNEIVTCSDIEPAVDGGLWCKHEKGYSNIRYMVQK